MSPDSGSFAPGYDRLQRASMIAGVAGVLACVAGAFMDSGRFFQSYLIGYVFWTGMAVGCLGILLLQHLSGGEWGLLIRRILEAGTRTLPLMVVLFIPLIFGMERLYVWASPEAVASDPILQHKAPYLNTGFFIARAAIYFGVWLVLAHFLNRWSREQDETGDVKLLGRFQGLSGIGTVLLVITVTFATVDWIMSLEPHWFSTIYGILLLAGFTLGALALAIITLAFLARGGRLARVVKPGHFHDLGKLLLAFVLVWAYFAFSQFLIIWAGNLPEEIPWYLKRMAGGWQWVILGIIGLHFLLPFMLLLSRDLKRRSKVLYRVAVLLGVMRLVDLYWMIIPAFGGTLLDIHWMDVAAPVGIGGIWFALFLRQLRSRPLLPQRDPHLKEMLEDGVG